ncbi:O-antigen ligase family protein [Streptomyces uncialis]|uniref:O-antigen ligase family protein n=1 Tax=Streptomyces uncialis TaxID=1048205 RepID=UPI000A56C6BF
MGSAGRAGTARGSGTAERSAASTVRAADAHGPTSDAVGMILLAACSGWALMTAAATGGRPEGLLLAVLAMAAAYAAGRIFGAVFPVGAPAVGALAGAVLAFLLPHLRAAPEGSSPLGHGGAAAALLALATGAACCAAWAARHRGARRALWTLAVLVTLSALLLDSLAGLTLCAGVLLISPAAARTARRAPALSCYGLAVAGVGAAAWAVAADVLPDGLMSSLEGQLTPYRVLLWRDALEMTREHPWAGVGPNLFGGLSPTVAESVVPDGRPHSALFQQAAEQGLVGVALLGAVFCWVLHALALSPRPTGVVLTAGASLTALAALAAVGDALSFMVVTVGAGLLAGVATARPLSPEPLPSAAAPPD